MEVKLNNEFWEDIGVDKPSKDKEENIIKFYHLYNRVIRTFIQTPSQEERIKQLKKLVDKDKNVLVEIFINSLESKIKNPDFFITPEKYLDLVNLNYYHRAILRRLRKKGKGEDNKDPYIRPVCYPEKIIFKTINENKIALLFKKYSKRHEKVSKKRKHYNKYIEKIVILTKIDGYWLIRTSFATPSERRIVKKVLKMKKSISFRENKLSDLFDSIKEKGKILDVSGKSSIGSLEFDYNYSSNSDTPLTELIENNATVINENSIPLIKNIRFNMEGKEIGLQIKPAGLGISHIKMQSPNLNFADIKDRIKILKEKIDIVDDTYIYSPVSEIKKYQFIFNSHSIENPHLEIVFKELMKLKNEIKIFDVRFYDSYKRCEDKNCSNHERPIPLEVDLCSECKKKLVSVGSMAKIKPRRKGVREWILGKLLDLGFEHKGVIPKTFNRKRINFDKFISNDKKEFLLYIQEEDKKIKDVAKKCKERGLMVLFVTYKGDFLDFSELENSSIGRLKLSELFIDWEVENKNLFKEKLQNLETRYDSCKNQNFEESYNILKKFLEPKFNFEVIESGTTMASKGKVFERLTTNLLKRVVNSWIDLGQTKQNQSVPDGVGGFTKADKNFVFGFDAKLKKYNKRKTGLKSKEIQKQIEYIKDYRSQVKSYGGLKSWILVVKSEEDYEAFTKSISKIKNGSGFNNISIIGIESLIKVADLYKKSLHNQINKNIFYDFFYKLLNKKPWMEKDKFDELIQEYESKLVELK